jgi:predicted branched-subunit amino acid permease
VAADRDAPTPRDALLRGARELLPYGPGVAAWGLVTGVAMVKSGLGPVEAIVLSLAAYAGSAQLAALPLMAAFAPIWVVLLTCTIVNLRFTVYGFVTRPYLAPASPAARIGLGYLVGDVMFARFVTLVREEPQYPHKRAYYLGGALSNWIAWQVSSIAGILAADAVPLGWGLELAGTLALIALVVPLCSRAPALVGVAVAATAATLTYRWPLRLGLLAAVALGVAAALLAERLGTPRDAPGSARGAAP